MRVFIEEQTFRQWWIFLILGSSLLVCSVVLFNSYSHSTSTAIEITAFGVIFLFFILIWKLRLKTKIDAKGIKTGFEPFSFFKKEFKWNEIDKCYVRKYAPLKEYGGWGVRGSGKKTAYNVSGDIGIQIFTTDKKNFLIGTNKPEEAKRVLRRYQEKIKNHE